MSNIVNAKISNASISMADHGCLTFWLTLSGAGWGVNYGGYCIGKGYLGAKEFIADTGKGLEAIMRIMDTVGVEKWEDLQEQYVRAVINSWGEPISQIGNLIEEKWFDITAFFKKEET